MIKIENPNPADDYEQSEENVEGVKMELFEQEEHLHQDLTFNSAQKDGSVISSQQQQQMGLDAGSGPNFPSTSNFEASNIE